MKRFFLYLKSRPLALLSVIFLCLIYLVMLFAPFFAPYSAGKSFENNSFHPANVEFSIKGIRVREFRAINKSSWTYVRVKDQECIHKLKFFVHGSEYSVLGIKCSLHLFGSSSQYPVYLLGADNLGRDLFSRIVYGSRISLTIGFVATFISLFLAVLFGGLSGFFGGLVDWSIMRFSEFFMLIPGLYFILFLRSLLNTKMDSGSSYMVITLILALVGWPGSARTIRGMVHSIKREEFVTDAQLEGIPSIVIIFKHIIPQISSLLIVSTALSIPGFIMSETTLSYLGLGISDPSVSWGSLINRDISTVSNLKNFPWLLYPVFLLLLVTLAFNFLGDALRDFYDPYHAVFKKSLNIKAFFEKLWPQKLKKSEMDERSENFLEDKSLNGASLLSEKKSTQTSGEGESSFVEKMTENSSQPSQLSSDVILSVQNLSVSFEILRGAKKSFVHAARGVSFDLKRGEILGLVGESGSGKSVSTTAIPGLTGANGRVSGKILYESRDLTLLSQKELRNIRGKEIALIFQEPGRSFDPLQTLESVFFETLKNSQKDISRDEAREKTVGLLREVGLPDPEGRLKNYPHQFSGGQLQRISIALSLAQNCKILIADEPTTALDVTVQSQIISLLLRLKKERNLSVIFISHDINLVSMISDRICVMYRGKIVETKKSSELMEKAEHPYTKALLAALPKFGSHYTFEKM
ncbi:MAG: dipeptide/oligopeptide/nickel ABC transporter permease/ATP-binding protein [Treponema sp.]|nr:dipeptide/oligopeptide/nickel ABC transporter permease/ATP-binding protein [Treponema sp.]